MSTEMKRRISIIQAALLEINRILILIILWTNRKNQQKVLDQTRLFLKQNRRPLKNLTFKQ